MARAARRAMVIESSIVILRSTTFSKASCLWGEAQQQVSLLSSLAFAQGWIVLSGISDASKACSRLRAACFQGAHAKFKAVLLVGICVVVGFIPMAVVSAPSGAQAQFATST